MQISVRYAPASARILDAALPRSATLNRSHQPVIAFSLEIDLLSGDVRHQAVDSFLQLTLQ
jgi:hypothetical protein